MARIRRKSSRSSCGAERFCMPKSRTSPFPRMDGACKRWPRRSCRSFVGRTVRKTRNTQTGSPEPYNPRTVQTLKVDVGHTTYPIKIGPGLLDDGGLLDSLIPGRDLCV